MEYSVNPSWLSLSVGEFHNCNFNNESTAPAEQEMKDQSFKAPAVSKGRVLFIVYCLFRSRELII